MDRFSKQPAVDKVNSHLAKALVYCPLLVQGGCSFRCVHIDIGTYPEGHCISWHSHNEYQIEIAVTGAFEFEAEGSLLSSLRPGKAVVIPWKLPHRWKCLKRGVMIGISLDLTPNPEFMHRDGSLSPGLHNVAGHLLKTKTNDLIKSATGPGSGPFYSTVTACHMFLLLAEIMNRVIRVDANELQDSDSKFASFRGSEVVGRVMKRLRKNPEEKVTLAQIAREAGLSTRQLHRLFAKHAGKSPHAWLMDQRLEMARKLLAKEGNSMQIKEIAFECGFASPTYFSNCFRKAYGYAPSSQVTGYAVMKSGKTAHMLASSKTDAVQSNPAGETQP